MTTNVKQRLKSIETLKNQLNTQAANVPQEDPFSFAGHQAWQDWTESCRCIERELEEAGELL